MKRRHLIWWVIAGPFAVLVAVLVAAHPFLAITELSGGHALVVEGWMDDPQLQKVVPLVMDPRYTHVYTTGTIRPFSYYLRNHEGLDVTLRAPVDGEITINVSGVTHGGFTLISDNSDTLLNEAVPASSHVFRARSAHPVQHLRVMAWNSEAMDANTDDIFILSFRIARQNVHFLQRETLFIRPEGRMEYAWPTYAHYARGMLMKYGVPEERITAVPSWGKPDSRTWANASWFAVRAKQDNISAYDVATIGVHARRSRALFQEASGPDVKVGVISIPDPYCTPDNWWKSVRGWYTMLKEIFGASEVQAVELTR